MTPLQFARATLITVSALFSISSHAIVLTVDDSYADNTYLSEGSYSGSFDINALMSATFGSNAYVINSGTIDFSFLDDADDVLYIGTTWVNSYGSWESGYSTTYDRIYNNPDESVTASAGGQSDTSSNTYYSNRTYSNTVYNSHRVARGYYRDVSCGWWDPFRSCEEWVDTSYNVTDRTYYYNNESGYALDSSFTLDLDDLAITDLMMDGILDYDLDVTGDMLLANISMTFDVTLVDVPEPSSIILMGLGLVGLGFARRRQAA